MRMRFLLMLLLTILVAPAIAADRIDIGSRRELFVDHHLIDKLEGDAKLQLHRPEPKEVVLVTDKPWEGNTCAYYTIFRDGDICRMYYRGSHYDTETQRPTHREVTCYAESKDGIHWTKPNLGLFEFEGSKENNIVWDGIGTHCFVAFQDNNPDCRAEARYKGIARGRPRGKKGLYVFKSPDGIHWSLMEDEPVITEGAFDSQNLAFWDAHAKVYREYHRTFHNGVRAIMTGTSTDFVKWNKPVLLDYGDAPKEHLYTNAVRYYERAPHILIGFPTRYLPNQGNRVEPTFMASRDGRYFHRWLEAVIPEDAPQAPRRQPQQLHDVGASAVAGQRPGILRLCHRGILHGTRQPGAPVYVPRGWLRFGAWWERRRRADYQADSVFRKAARNQLCHAPGRLGARRIANGRRQGREGVVAGRLPVITR